MSFVRKVSTVVVPIAQPFVQNALSGPRTSNKILTTVTLHVSLRLNLPTLQLIFVTFAVVLSITSSNKNHHSQPPQTYQPYLYFSLMQVQLLTHKYSPTSQSPPHGCPCVSSMGFSSSSSGNFKWRSGLPFPRIPFFGGSRPKRLDPISGGIFSNPLPVMNPKSNGYLDRTIPSPLLGRPSGYSIRPPYIPRLDGRSMLGEDGIRDISGW